MKFRVVIASTQEEPTLFASTFVRADSIEDAIKIVARKFPATKPVYTESVFELEVKKV